MVKTYSFYRNMYDVNDHMYWTFFPLQFSKQLSNTYHVCGTVLLIKRWSLLSEVSFTLYA